jgi:hypothetical protein
MTPKLPTYRTVAGVLENEKGSGFALLGWTALRTLLIAPPMLFVGVPAKQAFVGSALASMFISTLTLLRIFDAKHTGLKGAHCLSSGSALRRSRSRTRR